MVEPTLYAYEINGEADTGYTLLAHGPINEIYEKTRKGVYCVETEHEFFKVDRTGKFIVPANRSMYGKIVLSYDCTFYEGQVISDEDYVQLTDIYNLNIQEIMGYK